MSADIALIGLAVMGQNLILNMNDHGFVVCAYNRTTDKVDKFLANEAKDTKVIGAHSIEEMVNLLKKPRRIMLLVKAGPVVDEFIAQLLPHLERGDIIIDGGNSEYTDTRRRTQEVNKEGIFYVGTGVSGGEEGARTGPSLMPGGNREAWRHIKDIFVNIAANVDGLPCCDWVGSDGAGHFIKMVHNGIEYGDMQLICEAYHLLHVGLGLSHTEIGDVFDNWNNAELDSFLIEITRDIMRFNDENGRPLLPQIMDTAGQKGTGKWTATSALELGMPLTLIGESVFSRFLSTLKDQRLRASVVLAGPNRKIKTENVPDKRVFIDQISKALYASKIISYAQGFMLIGEAAAKYNWKLDYAQIALLWRGGCIIRSGFLYKITEAYERNPDLKNLILDSFFKYELERVQDGWREVVAQAVKAGIPTPCFSTAVAFYDGYRSPMLPANLIQAQRDYFGAHTYELLEKPGTYVHTNWTGRGGNVSASSYNA